MEFKVKVSTIYECSLEREFKTPMLCDVTKIHTGFGLTPKVTHTTDDENWGQIGSSKKIYVEKSMTQKGGFASMDKVLDRLENKYWKIQVDEFQSWMAGFYKFIGEWKTTEISEKETVVDYNYLMFSNKPILFPFNWIFAKVFWRTYMKKVIKNIKNMAYNNEPYKFA